MSYLLWVVPLEATARLNVSSEPSLLRENTLRTLEVLRFQTISLGLGEAPHCHQPWQARVGLFAVGKQHFGDHPRGTEDHILCDSIYMKYAE